MALPIGSRLGWVVVLVLAVGVSTVVRAGGQGDPIRSGIELLTVDFRALDEKGNPVTDLRLEQVSVRLGGVERPVKSLQYVHVAPPALRSTGALGAKELAPPFGSNYLGDAGRTIILVLENESLRPTIARQVIDGVGTFISGLAPRDRVALLTTPRGGLLADLSRDHAYIRKLLSGVSGQGPQRATDSERACRTRDTLVALTGLLEGLAAIDIPKTIVFVSGGIVTPRRDAAANAAPGPCELKSVHYDDVGHAAFAARANFFVIKADDLVIDPAASAVIDPAASRFRSSDEELAGMESLAGVTSGTLLRVTPAETSAFARVARETSGYYLAAIDPEAGQRNGLSHRIDVSAARPGVTIRVRPRVVVPKSAAKSTTPAQTPQAMLRDGRMYRDLPLRASAFVSADPQEERLRIVGVAESLDRTAAITTAAFGLIDSRGKLVAQWTANERELSRSPVASAGLAPPGPYRLRVAAVDTAGRRGATDYEFDAALISGSGLRLSTLVLGVSLAGFSPRLQFSAEPTAMGFFEVYGTVPDSEKLSVAFELAGELDGAAIVRTPGTLTVTRESGVRRASGVVPIATLPPGDYIIRGIVSLDGNPIGQVHRTLRKSAS
jgi:hypothetical protein